MSLPGRLQCNACLLGTAVVPFSPFLFGFLLIKTEQSEKGYPYHLGFTEEPSLERGVRA